MNLVMARKFGEAISTIRIEKKMTLLELAETSNLSLQMLRKFEVGEKEIKLEQIIRICRGMNIKTDSLFRKFEKLL
jgi:transcriptional regulator with XRE-family HTH domain